ncbi:hypothetical protein P691DRAFT_770607 [Macrolepiota fuliginosa MF-IS2]|uniref:Uncharacterized protein n=1 Tax=Macrolepiota fuliginosa MF-IS2 TaxID=1400762 RepID=A0A9P5XP74_9AGAR|nr:hypothetical protein P691DRAFT_770607 [Macrolepiota fuliginosa MF-IS2]
MGRTGRVSPVVSSLPKVVFEKIEDDVSTQPGGVHDLQARSYGYNDFSDFMRPEHYIRHIEPLESDLARQVEYDMDEQDQEWLDAINAERRKEQLDKISCELFEIIMDRLEKEWFDLTKNIPKPDLALPSEDSTCALCDDSEGENSNAIVFCDGCNLAVHQDCYGVPYIPEGQWLCRKCTVSPENPVQCILCPNEGGAFKQTTNGDWVHLLCAIWVPETRVVNEVFMEPVSGVERISKQRWKLRCNICDIREGACIQCAKTSCFLAFHATCARKEKLLSSMKSTQGSEPATLTCYCERHLPKEQQEVRATALAAEESESGDEANATSNKSARAYAKTYHTGPPLVPVLIVKRILSYVTKVTVRKKLEFVNTLCRYWSLKREARRGAPLLKRLHLEPWTATGGIRVRSDQEKAMKLEQLRHLRDDLLNLRALTELCRKRESRKYRQAEIVYDVVATVFFSHQDAMRHILDRIVSLDKQEFFKNPVSKQVVPDYYDIVKEPMCWTMIEAKLDRHEYWDVQAFKDDVELVIDNALLYNKSDSAIYRAASRLKKNVQPFYAELDKERVTTFEAQTNGVSDANTIDPEELDCPAEEAMDVDGAISPNEFFQPKMSIGDLEPPLDALELLTSAAALKPDLVIDLQDEPFQSLLEYELATPKPPPTPAPLPPPKPKKPKRDRKAEYERAKAKKAAAAAAAMATAAEALTLLNGGYHYEATSFGVPQQVGPQPLSQEAYFPPPPPPPPPPAPPVVHEPQTFLDNSPEFRMPNPRQIVIDTSADVIEAGAGTEEPAETSPTSARAERGPRRKRSSFTFPGQSDIPPMVADVDNRDSFKMFDAGWILPPDHRRGGRVPVDRSTQPPPRKRAKTGEHPTPFEFNPLLTGWPEQAPSRLSIASTPMLENQTFATSPLQEFSSSGPPLSSASTQPLSVQAPTPSISEVKAPPQTPVLPEAGPSNISEYPPSAAPLPPPTPSAPVSSSSSRFPPPLDLLVLGQTSKIVEGANGTIIIEELDTPAIRRAKNWKRKEEKRQEMLRRDSLAAATAAETVSAPAFVGEVPYSGEPSSSTPMKGGVDSELSSLSEFGSELTEESGKPKAARKKGRRRKSSAVMPTVGLPKKNDKDDLASVLLGDREMLEGGTLVWAKADSYPWWPGVIFEDDDPDVPRNILQGCQEAREKRKMKLHILRFFDKNQSWQYLPVDRLKLLGEDSELDAEMQAPNSKRQRWKSANVRRDCCDAYKLAMSEMETNSEPDLGGVPLQT